MTILLFIGVVLRKAQSALEYISTYLWAILTIAIIGAALYLYGSFSPKLPSTCGFKSTIICQNIELTNTGYLTVNIRQYASSAIRITAIGCNNRDTVSHMQNVTQPVSLPTYGNATLGAQCYVGDILFSGPLGANFKGYLIINYTDLGTGFSHTVIGSISDSVSRVVVFSSSSSSIASTSTSSLSSTVFGSTTPTTSLFTTTIIYGTGSTATTTLTTTTISSTPTYTQYSNAINASSALLTYQVSDAASFVAIMIGAGNYELASVSLPSGCSQKQFVSSADESESAYIAVCQSQSQGTYIVNAVGTSSFTGLSMAAYVFSPGSSVYYSTGASASIKNPLSVTLESLGFIYLCDGGSSGFSFGISGNVDVNDSYSGISHQSSNICAGSTTRAPLAVAGIELKTTNATTTSTTTTSTTVTVAPYIYCVGGSSPPYNSTYYASVSSNGVSGWASTANYPISLESAGCSIYQGYIYCVGSLSWYGAEAYYAPISGSGFGNWVATTDSPVSLGHAGCSIYNDYIYCLGGYSSSLTYNGVYYAPLTNPGIGQWSATTVYPISIRAGTCSISGGYIYCVGGQDVSPYNQVYYAPITSNGVGNWVATTIYPLPINSNSCVISGNYIYCIGSESLGQMDRAYYAPVSSGGIGNWVATANYPYDFQSAGCATLNNYIYCVGTGGSGAGNGVNYAAISSNGIGNWVATANYPNPYGISNGYCEIPGSGGGYLSGGGPAT